MMHARHPARGGAAVPRSPTNNGVLLGCRDRLRYLYIHESK